MKKEKKMVIVSDSNIKIIGGGQRDITIDIVKGIGIILMVFRHARAPFSDFVLLFHMAIFFIASGYLLNCGYAESVHGVFQFIKKKIKGLWAPYFGFTCAFILLNNLFLKINIYSDNPDFLIKNILEEEYVKIGDSFGLGDIVTQVIKAIFFRAGTQIGGALWFFMTLFTVLIAYMLCEFLLKKVLPKINVIYLQTVVSLLCLAIGYICMLKGLSIKGLDKTFSVYILIHFGRIMRYYSVMDKIRNIDYENSIMILAGLVVLLCGYHKGYIAVVSNDIENPIFFVLMSIAGWGLLYGVADELRKISARAATVFSYISVHSVPIIALHFLAFKAINMIAVAAYGFEWYMIAAFPVLMRTGLWWILYLVAGVGIPLLFQKLYLLSRMYSANKRRRRDI